MVRMIVKLHVTIILIVLIAGSAASQRAVQEPSLEPQSANEAQELAKKLSNPVASLISFPLQSNFDFGMGTGSGWRYTLNVQPVIPIKLSDSWSLISRTIIPVIHQGNVTGPNTSQNGLGDTVQSFFFSPNKTEPLIWAVGPVVLIPTATDQALGAQKWGVGPTALALKQKKGWTYGVLANHIWSVAGKSNRADVSATFIQPFFSYSTKDAWTYSINTESTYDWNSDSWSIPINPFYLQAGEVRQTARQLRGWIEVLGYYADGRSRELWRAYRSHRALSEEVSHR